MTEMIEYDYNPCVRKGKYTQIVQKKKKKYEPKAQKRNLDKTHRHKIINIELDALDDNKHVTEFIGIAIMIS